MKNRLRVAVVVVTHNRNKDCRETIESLLINSELPDEIIVVDDTSSTPFKFEHELVHILRYDQEIGLSASRNAGVRASNTDIIVFIDDDAIATKNWIKTIREVFRNNVDIIGGMVLPIYFTTPPKWWNSRALGGFVGIYNQNIIGCNFAVKKELFSKIGFFNPQLGRRGGTLLSAEEDEFFKRSNKLGGKTSYIPHMIVYHKVLPYRLSLRYLIKRAWWQGKSNFIMYPTSYRIIPRIIARVMNHLILHFLSLFFISRNSVWYLLRTIQQLGYLSSIIGIGS